MAKLPCLTSNSNMASDHNSAPFENMLWIPGGTFRMGSNHHYPEEAPEHLRTVRGFWMDTYLVTNTEFHRFVEATGYITMAERVPDARLYPGALPHMLKPGSVVFRQPSRAIDMRNYHNWWTWVRGADWRHPEGPSSSIQTREDHPIVHVSFEDV